MTGQVAKPKVYIDYIAYARAVGLPVSFVENETVVGTPDNIFTQNPSNISSIDYISTAFNGYKLMCRFTNEDDQNLEIIKLLSSTNFVAAMGHNFSDLDLYDFTLTSFTYYDVSVGSDLLTSILYGDEGLNGFTIWSADATGISLANTFGLSFAVKVSSNTIPLRLGSLFMGRSFTFPHNANLSMNIDYNTDKIKKSKTLGGFDVIDVGYSRQPDWDGRPPFASTNASNLTTHTGRRSWAVTFSFLKVADTFPSDMGENFMFDNDFDEEGTSTVWWGLHDTNNITSHFMTLTMNGQLPFIFQPDDTKATFAMCRLRSNSFSVTQSAPNLFTCKMTFDETW